jgi:hypothetical protein
MTAITATVLRVSLASVALTGLACRESSRSRAPSRTQPLLTAYVAPRVAQRMMGPMLDAAARHDWSLSFRTDSAAIVEADLAIVDSAGRLVARLRAGSPVAAQARTLAEAVLPGAVAP